MHLYDTTLAMLYDAGTSTGIHRRYQQRPSGHVATQCPCGRCLAIREHMPPLHRQALLNNARQRERDNEAAMAAMFANWYADDDESDDDE